MCTCNKMIKYQTRFHGGIANSITTANNTSADVSASAEATTGNNSMEMPSFNSNNILESLSDEAPFFDGQNDFEVAMEESLISTQGKTEVEDVVAPNAFERIENQRFFENDQGGIHQGMKFIAA